MKQVCKSCLKQTENYHYHHIVPKSRGGSDDDGNLTLLCVECHGKAHNVSFGGKKGLIKEKAQEAIKKGKEDREWFLKNFHLYEDLIDKLYDKFPEKANFLITMINNHFITAGEIKDLITTGKTKFRRTLDIDLKTLKI